MTEHLSAREGVPHLEGRPVSYSTYTNHGCRCEGCKAEGTAHQRKLTGATKREEPKHGTISRYNSVRHRCRCYLCTAAQRDYQQARREKKKKAEGAGESAPVIRSLPERSRPPGMVWMDSTEYSHVVRCERCDKNYGVWVDHWEAEFFAKNHRNSHAGEPPFDWSAWSEERLIKNPGGRPPLEDKPLCSDEFCTEDAHAKGLCMRHYQAARRANALPAEVEDPYEGMHGEMRGYRRGCRCEKCRSARNTYQRDYNRRMVEERPARLAAWRAEVGAE